MEEKQEHPRPIRTLRQHFWRGTVDAHRRRPVSFYMLLSIPVVLLLALGFFQTPGDPRRFAFGLAILFIFLGVVLIRACHDILALTRELLSERRQSYKETLGDEAFLESLRDRGRDRDRRSGD